MLPGTLSNHYGTAVKMSETENQIARMSAEWELLLAKSANTRAVPMEWERSIASMQREVNLLRDQGRWLGGYRTLMHALGIDLLRAFRTADFGLIHAADCRSTYSSWTCCGVRY